MGYLSGHLIAAFRHTAEALCSPLRRNLDSMSVAVRSFDRIAAAARRSRRSRNR
ncbi:hypothetical protein [Kibdelosporangium philippinense]|uniref:hypothetical protein n=1 Tax=Kibdelosporangium philippinense TaxID=211113 RepID=UPI003608F0C6